MTFVKEEDIEELTDSAVTNQLASLVRQLPKIASHFRDMPEYNRDILAGLLKTLDEADDLGTFGTEGWRYFLE